MNGNYLKLYRSLLDWEWYGDVNTCRLFIHMLLKANWQDCRFQGTTVPRGSFVSSYPHLAEECGMTINELRTALKHLKSTGEITVKTNNKYSVFTLNNYCQYQDVNSQNDTQDTVNAQSVNSQLTPIEEEKKVRKEEGNNKNNMRFTPPSVEEVAAYCMERNNGIDAQAFVDHYEANGWMRGKNKIKDWKACVRTWERSRGQTRQEGTAKRDRISEVDMW